MRKIIVYGKAWCSPCATLKKMLENSEVDFEYKDIMNNMDDVSKYGLKSAPTTLIFENGEVVKKVVGVNLEEVLSNG